MSSHPPRHTRRLVAALLLLAVVVGLGMAGCEKRIHEASAMPAANRTI